MSWRDKNEPSEATGQTYQKINQNLVKIEGRLGSISQRKSLHRGREGCTGMSRAIHKAAGNKRLNN